MMVCRLFGAKPLSEPMLPYCQLDPKGHISMKCYVKFKSFHWRKCTWKWRLRNGGHFASAPVAQRCWGSFSICFQCTGNWFAPRHSLKLTHGHKKVTTCFWPFVRWIPLTKASDAELWRFLWSVPWINGWVNNRDTGNLRRHRGHYGVAVMQWLGVVMAQIFHDIMAKSVVMSQLIFLWTHWGSVMHDYVVEPSHKWFRWRLDAFPMPSPYRNQFTVTGEFPAQRASNAENVSIWWRHHE